MLIRKIKHFPGNDAALRLNKYFLSESGIHFNRFGKCALALSAAVNIGMVKEICAVFKGGVNKFADIRLAHVADSHAADRNRRHAETAFS